MVYDVLDSQQLEEKSLIQMNVEKLKHDLIDNDSELVLREGELIGRYIFGKTGFQTIKPYKYIVIPFHKKKYSLIGNYMTLRVNETHLYHKYDRVRKKFNTERSENYICKQPFKFRFQQNELIAVAIYDSTNDRLYLATSYEFVTCKPTGHTTSRIKQMYMQGVRQIKKDNESYPFVVQDLELENMNESILLMNYCYLDELLFQEPAKQLFTITKDFINENIKPEKYQQGKFNLVINTKDVNLSIPIQDYFISSNTKDYILKTILFMKYVNQHMDHKTRERVLKLIEENGIKQVVDRTLIQAI
jgi:hypothetical protein